MSAPLAYDRTYLKSISGIIKISCMVCCFLGFLCIVCSSVPMHNFRGSFYSVIVAVAFLCSCGMLVTCLFQVWQRKFYTFNAAKYEFYLNVFLAFICFVAGCASISLDMTAYTIAAFFALLAFSLYALDGYLGYRLHRRSDAQTQTQSQPLPQIA